jgi:competence protein ComEA
MTPIWHIYKIPILLGVFSILLITISIVLLIKSTQTVTPIEFSISNQASQSANLASISVDVEGAVASAGVITLPAGSRVEDALLAVGGLRNTADMRYVSQNVNRAMKLSDGMKIYIPEANEDMTSHNSKLSNSTAETSHNLNSQNIFVSINTGSKEQLDALTGVGPITAQKIIDNRPYMSLNDLVTKKVIGQSLFDKLKNMLSL